MKDFKVDVAPMSPRFIYDLSQASILKYCQMMGIHYELSQSGKVGKTIEGL